MRRCVFLLLGALVLGINPARSEPWLPPGDIGLRHDVQLLVDSQVINSPVSSWPLSWGDLAQDVNAFEDHDTLDAGAQAALTRLTRRLRQELSVGEVYREASLSAADNPTVLRTFSNTPRGELEAGAKIKWTGDLFAVRLQATVAGRDPRDAKDFRFDGSYAAVAIGNWKLSAGSMDRWWGPGWEGSLILSNATRPIPSLALERNFSDPFDSKWLKWIGRWSTSIVWGQLEEDRAVSNARFFGWRVNFRPTKDLEFGLLRTAQWCGSGRPCGFDTFFDMLVGNDNQGSEGVTFENEASNQLAGGDIRWKSPLGDWPYAVYLQLIGEDEAGGLPSKLLGQLGIEYWNTWRGTATSYRLHAEFSDTTCSFADFPGEFNCAYNHGIYQTGYRYRQQPIGHPMDGDGRMFSLGGVVVIDAARQWNGVIRYVELNRGGNPDSRHTLTPTPLNLVNAELSHRRETRFGEFTVGAGFDQFENEVSNRKDSDARLFVQWRQLF